MKLWHETWVAKFGLRLSGAALLAVGAGIAFWLHHLAQSASPRDPSTLMMLLSAILFLCGSAGSALLFVGPGLWETVEVSERWRRMSPADLMSRTQLDQD